MRFVLLLTVLSIPGVAVRALVPQEVERKDHHFFSGTIVEVAERRITVSRTVLGKESGTRTFQLTPDTRVEGNPKVQTRVTVRFVTTEAGDEAVHIIVRAPKK